MYVKNLLQGFHMWPWNCY